MGLYKYLREGWKKSKEVKDLYKQRIIEWSRQPATVRIARPTRLDRAKSLGYKAKQGIVVVRQRVPRGGRKREQFAGGRRGKTNRRNKVVSLNPRNIAEMRVARKYPNLEVLNSYYVGVNKYNRWYEVILVDPNHPQIINDKDLNWVTEPQHERRVFRGLTSAGKATRGLRHKGKGAEKVRPSNNANKNRLK